LRTYSRHTDLSLRTRNKYSGADADGIVVTRNLKWYFDAGDVRKTDNVYNTKLQHRRRKWKLVSGAEGEEINSNKHKLGSDVKAVTKHLFGIEKRPEGLFCCQVVLDI